MPHVSPNPEEIADHVERLSRCLSRMLTTAQMGDGTVANPLLQDNGDGQWDELRANISALAFALRRTGIDLNSTRKTLHMMLEGALGPLDRQPYVRSQIMTWIAEVFLAS